MISWSQCLVAMQPQDGQTCMALADDQIRTRGVHSRCGDLRTYILGRADTGGAGKRVLSSRIAGKSVPAMHLVGHTDHSPSHA